MVCASSTKEKILHNIIWTIASYCSSSIVHDKPGMVAVVIFFGSCLFSRRQIEFDITLLVTTTKFVNVC